MKVAVLNDCGNVGKSVLARHLVAPRLQGAKVITVGPSHQEPEYLIDQWHDVYLQVLQRKAAVVDVASHVTKEFVRYITKCHELRDVFTTFIVPVTPDYLPQERALKTVRQLTEALVPPDKIVVVLNGVRDSDSVRNDFRLLLGDDETARPFRLIESAVVWHNGVYSYLDERGSLAELVGAGMEAGLIVEKVDAAQRLAFQRLACVAVDNLNQVFAALFGETEIRPHINEYLTIDIHGTPPSIEEIAAARANLIQRVRLASGNKGALRKELEKCAGISETAEFGYDEDVVALSQLLRKYPVLRDYQRTVVAQGRELIRAEVAAMIDEVGREQYMNAVQMLASAGTIGLLGRADAERATFVVAPDTEV